MAPANGPVRFRAARRACQPAAGVRPIKVPKLFVRTVDDLGLRPVLLDEVNSVLAVSLVLVALTRAGDNLVVVGLEAAIETRRVRL